MRVAVEIELTFSSRFSVENAGSMYVPARFLALI